ncbi:MAG: cupredoxin domain-containing protein [Mycobacteriales bacterium]
MSVITPSESAAVDASRLSSSSPPFWIVYFALLSIGLLIGSAVTLRSERLTARRPTAAAPVAPTAGIRAGVPVVIELGDMFIKPAAIDVPAGQEIVFEVHNGGQMAHDLTMAGGTASRLLGPGETQTVSFGPLTSSTTLYCSIPGHRPAGMELKLTVATTPAAARGAGH